MRNNGAFFGLLPALALLCPNLIYAQEEFRKRSDFSQTNSVTILLWQPERQGRLLADGLEHAFWEADGLTTLTNVQGVPCRSLSLSHEGRSKGYFYFAIDPTFKRRDITHVKIKVDYFDGSAGHEGVFGVEYDSSGVKGRSNPAYTPLLPNVPLKGSQKCLTTTFHIKDATFLNSQNGNADFRLWASPPELCLRRVTVTRETPEQSPKPKPLPFTPEGEANLRNWNVQWDSGSKPSFSSHTQDAPRWLEIRAPGTRAAGSWRTSVFLEPGQYQFVGKVKTSGLSGHVGLRASYRSGARTLNAAADWTSLTYDLILQTPGHIEFVCELRADQGTARFDADSLKLIRKQ